MRVQLCRTALLLISLVAPKVAAQATLSTAVHVLVRDSTRRAVGGADVTIVRGLNDVLAHATSDDNGRSTLVVPPAADNYQLIVRHIGYQRVDRFIHVGADTVTFDVPLSPTARQLAPVTVTAGSKSELKLRSYHIDADEIASSDRNLFDAADIVSKLRPDMICGRECFRGDVAKETIRNPLVKCAVLVMDFTPQTNCPASDDSLSLATNVWVNGVHIRSVALDETANMRRFGPLLALSRGTMTVLSQIKPEHIEEINYLDSTDGDVDKPGAQAAIFIVLKPGVVYQPGAYSHVEAVAHPATALDSLATKAPTALALYRYRLLGVYDDSTGDPIADAEVLDVETGDHTQTPSSGIVSLVFLPDGGSPLRITKPGYEDLILAVQISPDNTTPLTLTMTRKRER